MTRPKISACVTCFNEETKIRRCLESLQWCDEIVVVDSFSTDDTVKICREFTERVYEHEWLGYIGQKNLIREMASHEWVLFLDADEEVSPALREEILRELTNNEKYVGFQFPRQVYYLGRWIRHGSWYPDLKLRLFEKEKGRSSGREPHDHVEVDGQVKTLRSPIWHYTYDDINDHVLQSNRFSTITAEEKYKEGFRYHFIDFLVRPPWRFFKGYILKRGFLEGFQGLFIALMGSFEVMLKYAKIKELGQKEKKKDSP